MTRLTHIRVFLAAALALLGAVVIAPGARATVVNFDDLTCFGGAGHNVPLGSTAWQGLGAAPVFLPVDINGVTRVVAEFSNAGQFLIDDLTYNVGVVATDGATWGAVKGLFR